MTGLPSTPALLVVIHQVSPQHAADQAALAFDNGADGVWLINHFDPPAGLAESVASVRNRLGSELWVGINPLGLDALTAARFARTVPGVDGLWCDDAGIDPLAGIDQPFAAAVLDELGDWEGAYFGGVAFKYQSVVEPEFEAIAAATAAPWMSVVCTSGAATGSAAELAKLERMARGAGATPLAVASGVTVDNVDLQLRHVDFALVATSVSVTNTDLNPSAVAELAARFAATRSSR